MMQLMLMSSEPAAAARDEDGLIRAAAAGDRQAFGELYVRYARMVHGILLTRVSPAEAEEAGRRDVAHCQVCWWMR